MLGILIVTSHIFGAGSSGGIGALGIDFKALILQIITFLLVFWLLKKFALDKILKTLEQRRNTIDDSVKLGLEMEAEKALLAGKLDKMLASARTEADKIIAAGHQEAKDLIKAAEEAAARKTQSLLDDANARIGDEIEQARKNLEQEILFLVAEASEAVLGEKLDSPKDSQFIRRQLQKVGHHD